MDSCKSIQGVKSKETGLFFLLQSEDEALQRALELSLAENKPQAPKYLLYGERGGMWAKAWYGGRSVGPL